jgi:nicotinamidase-related amidase
MQMITIDTKTTALLLMHFQDDIVALFPRPEIGPVIDRCQHVIQAARAKDLTIVFANIKFRSDYLEVNPRNQNGVWLQSMGLFTRSQVTPELARQTHDILIEGQRVSVFYATALELILRSRGIETLIMAGLTSTGVVLSSLAYASDADYRIVVLEDCCYDPDRTAHERLFAGAFQTRASIATAAEFIGSLGG